MGALPRECDTRMQALPRPEDAACSNTNWNRMRSLVAYLQAFTFVRLSPKLGPNADDVELEGITHCLQLFVESDLQ